MVHFVCQHACGAGIYSSCLTQITQTKLCNLRSLRKQYPYLFDPFCLFILGDVGITLKTCKSPTSKPFLENRLKKNIASAAWSLDGPAARPGKNTASSCIQICVSLEIAQAQIYPTNRMDQRLLPSSTWPFGWSKPSRHRTISSRLTVLEPSTSTSLRRTTKTDAAKCQRQTEDLWFLQMIVRLYIYIYILPIGWLYIYIISPTTKKSNHGNQSLTEDFLHEGMSMTSVPRDVSCDLIRSDFRCWGVEVCFFSATDMLTKSMKSDLSKYNLQSS